MLELLEKLRADQFDRWQAGERTSAETYIDKHPTVRDDPEAAVDLIYSEILLREQFGEVVDFADYLRRFPRYADRLEPQLHLHDLFRADLLGEAHPLTLHALSTDPGASADRQSTVPLRPPRCSSADDPAHWPDIPGFTIEGRLGRGGYGIVYRARQRSLNRTVALKVLHHPDAPDPAELALFRNEAESVAQLHHPNIVQIHEFGEHEGRPYCVMEYVDGGGLERRLTGEPLPPREAAALVAMLADAIHVVHGCGIVHRDLKPANILLSVVRGPSSVAKDNSQSLQLTIDNGQRTIPKIADFGLAKRAGAEVSLIKSGTVVGTPTYMAPEQACGRSKEVGPATDVYSLGAILYEALTGRVPFKGDSLLDQLEQVKTKPPVAPRRLQPGLPRALEIICLKCLEKEPQRRYASAAGLADDLRNFLDGRPITAKPERWPARLLRAVRRRPLVTTALALAVAVGLSLAGYYATVEDPEKTIHRQLDKDGSYTFIGAEGSPKVMHWPIVTGTVVKPRENSEGFSYESASLCPLELLSTPGHDSYKFRAKVRHENASHHGKAGIFFGLHKVATPKGDLFCYCELSINDLTPPPVQGGSSPLQLMVVLWRDADKLILKAPAAPALQYAPAIVTGNLKVWRDFRVEATPAVVRAFFDGQLVGEATHADLSAITRAWCNTHSELSGLDLDFRPNGGFGLYVFEGHASFQHAVIETNAGTKAER
jgi:serine/threonine protein kinase